MAKHFSKHTINLIAAFFLSYILHILPVFFIKLPTSGPDEIGTLALAAYLAGNDWSYLVSRHGAFYGFGSSWFLAPLFLIIKNPYVLYNVMRCILALFLSAPTIIAYKILQKYYKVQSFKLLFFASVACSLFTNTTADILINETFLILGTWLTVYFLIIMAYTEKKRTKIVLSFVLALLLAYMATVHTRSVFYFVIVFIMIAIFYVIKRVWLVHFPTFMLSSCLYFAAQCLVRLAQNTLYNNIGTDEVTGSIESLGSTYGNVRQMLQLYGPKLSIEAILSLFFSNMYGLVIFSSGILIPCFVVFFIECKRLFFKHISDNFVSVPSFFCGIGLLAMVGALSIVNIYHGATLYFGNELGDGRFFFYLRYYINFMPPILLTLVFYIEEGKRSGEMLIFSAIFMVITALGFCYFFLRVVYNNQYDAFDVGKLFDAFLLYGTNEFLWYHYVIAGIIIGAILLLFYGLARQKHTWIIMLLLCCVLFYEQMYQCITFRKPIADTVYKCLDASSQMFAANDAFSNKINTLYVYSKSTYKLEYAAQLVFKDICVLPYKEKPDEDFLLLSNQEMDLKGFYMVVLDENEYLYTNSRNIADTIYNINPNVEFVLQE